MTLIKENKVRREIPNRMMSATFALPIDGRRVVGILDYIASCLLYTSDAADDA